MGVGDRTMDEWTIMGKSKANEYRHTVSVFIGKAESGRKAMPYAGLR